MRNLHMVEKYPSTLDPTENQISSNYAKPKLFISDVRGLTYMYFKFPHVVYTDIEANANCNGIFQLETHKSNPIIKLENNISGT